MAVTRLPGHRDPIELLRALTDPDPCHYDHHGRCQAHGQGSDDYCAHGAARAYLTALDRTITADNPTGSNPAPHTGPHTATPTPPHDNPTPGPDGEWYVVRITPVTWTQQIVGRHHYRGTADTHATLRRIAAAIATLIRGNLTHTYSVWASHIHNTQRPDPAPVSPQWSSHA